MADNEQPSVSLQEQLQQTRRNQVVVLLELVRIQFTYQEVADLCATLRNDPETRRQEHHLPSVPSSAHVEELIATLREAAKRIDQLEAALRAAGLEP